MNFSSNPTLTALGYDSRDRVVIFHADDLGMCQATVSAYEDLQHAGLLSSAAIMMPCAWAPAAAQVAMTNPTSDVGVHWTLTSEWDRYRWSPLNAPPGSALMDAEGYFPRRVEDARQASNDLVHTELATQLKRALSWGIDVTHVDTHMGTAAHPKYFASLIELAITHGIPPLFPRLKAAGWQTLGLAEEDAQQMEQVTHHLEERGLPMVDHLRGLPLDTAGDHTHLTRQMLRDLPPGLTHFILHPARDTPELRAITPDWAARVANYQAFMDPALRVEVHDQGIQVIGYRPIREIFRQHLARSTGQALT